MYVVYWASCYWIWNPWQLNREPDFEHDETVTYFLIPNPPGVWTCD